MSLSNLYVWTNYVTDPQIEMKAKRRGFIKRKKNESLLKNVGIKEGSHQFYFMFHLHGSVLAGYEKEPKMGSEAKIAFYLADVVSIQQNYRDKKGHVLLMVNESELVFKFDEDKEQTDWLLSISYLRDYYRQNSTMGQGVMDDVPVELQMLFASEIEIDKWQEIRKKFDYSKFLTDKGLKPILSLPVDIARNRLLISEVTKVTKHRKDIKKDDSEKTKDPLEIDDLDEPETPTTFAGGSVARKRNHFFSGASPYYVVMLSQWQVYRMDEQAFVKDHRSITPEMIRNCLPFNRIHFYEYKKEGDISDVRKICPVL